MGLRLKHIFFAIAVTAGTGASAFSAKEFLLGASTPDVVPGQVVELGIDEMRDAAILPHYSKISGIVDGLVERGIEIPGDLEMNGLHIKRNLALRAARYQETPDFGVTLEMFYSEGQNEAIGGQWTTDAASFYAEQVIALNADFGAVFDAAVRDMSDQGVADDLALTFAKKAVGAAAYIHLKDAGFVDPSAELDEGLDLASLGDESKASIVEVATGALRTYLQKGLTNLDEIDAAFNAFAMNITSPLDRPAAQDHAINPDTENEM